MSYEQYWDGDCTLVKDYRKAFEIRKEFRNQELWLQGMYIYDALCEVAPVLRPFSKATHPRPYAEKPYPVSKTDRKKQKEKDAQNYNKVASKFTAIAASINKQRHKGEDTIARSD